MKVLVILLSGQHVPNLLSIEAVKPDKIAYVETKEMKRSKAWSNLENALEMNDVSIDSKRFELVEENSMASIRGLFKEILGRYIDDEIIVNLTGGTKLMSIGAYDIFKSSEARLIYKPFRHVNEFIDIMSDSRLDFETTISIRQFLKGYGYEISDNDKQIEKHLDECSSLFSFASHLAGKHRTNDVRGCLSNLARINFEKGSEMGDLSIDISHGLRTNDIPLKMFLVANLGMNSMEEEILHGELSRKYVRFLTGEWLEIFIWGLLNTYGNELGFRDPNHSVTFFKRNKPGVTKNELDVAFLNGTKLCIVECKSGKQGMDKDAHGVIYKMKAVMDQTKALDISGFLVTTSDNVLDSGGNVKRHIGSRSDEYGLRLILSDDIIRLSKAHESNDKITIIKILSQLFN